MEYDLRNVVCGRCGEELVRDGKLLDLAFLVPAEPVVEDVRCEPCAREEGTWEEVASGEDS